MTLSIQGFERGIDRSSVSGRKSPRSGHGGGAILRHVL
jgi:hypothetical protein